jgi:hypothetical protein
MSLRLSESAKAPSPLSRIASHVPIFLKSKALSHMANAKPRKYRLIFQQPSAQFSGNLQVQTNASKTGTGFVLPEHPGHQDIEVLNAGSKVVIAGTLTRGK